MLYCSASQSQSSRYLVSAEKQQGFCGGGPQFAVPTFPWILPACQKSLKLGARNSEATKIFLPHTLNQTVTGKIYQQLLAVSVLKIGNEISTNLFIIFESVTQNIPSKRRGWEPWQNSLESSIWARVGFELPNLGIWFKMWTTGFI